MNHRIYFFTCLLIIFSACTQEETSCQVDTSKDTVVTAIDKAIVADSASYISAKNETEDNKAAIEKKFGKQWDFCDCVKKNDSINKVIDKTPENANFDPIFARMEVIDKHCKELLTAPNSTPEERAIYERKVKKCLKNK